MDYTLVPKLCFFKVCSVNDFAFLGFIIQSDLFLKETALNQKYDEKVKVESRPRKGRKKKKSC